MSVWRPSSSEGPVCVWRTSGAAPHCTWLRLVATWESWELSCRPAPHPSVSSQTTRATHRSTGPAITVLDLGRSLFRTKFLRGTNTYVLLSRRLWCMCGGFAGLRGVQEGSRKLLQPAALRRVRGMPFALLNADVCICCLKVCNVKCFSVSVWTTTRAWLSC